MARAFGHLTGAKIEGAQHGVIRSEASFGGGKTHSLIAGTHVAKGARPPNLSEFVDPAIVPERDEDGSKAIALLESEDIAGERTTTSAIRARSVTATRSRLGRAACRDRPQLRAAGHSRS